MQKTGPVHCYDQLKQEETTPVGSGEDLVRIGTISR